jgi:hypothetical protein
MGLSSSPIYTIPYHENREIFSILCSITVRAHTIICDMVNAPYMKKDLLGFYLFLLVVTAVASVTTLTSPMQDFKFRIFEIMIYPLKRAMCDSSTLIGRVLQKN